MLTNTYGYNDNGNLNDRQNQTAADLPDLSEFFYDDYDRRERRVDRGGTEPDITTHYEYIVNGQSEGMDVVREYVEQGGGSPASDIHRDIDELGRPWKERIVKTPPTTNDNADRITTTTFDITGNEVATRVADTALGAALITREFTCFDYPDSMTQRLTATPLTEAFTDYQTDGRGNVTVIDDPVGNRTRLDFDALGQRWRSRHYEGTANLQLRAETVYTSREQKALEVRYDGAGAALDQQRWEYDALGFQSRWARMANPASAAPIQVNTDRVIDTTNDGVGRSLSRTDYEHGATRTTQWNYDDIGRLLTITHPVASNTEALTYYASSTRPETRTFADQIGSRVLRTVFDPFGRLKTETWQGTLPDIATTYAYDAAGRRVTTTDPKGYVTNEVYDGIDQRTQISEDFGGADQRSVMFTYTQKGDLAAVTANDGEGPQVTSYLYDLASRRLRITHPDSSFIAFTYYNSGWVETRTTEDAFVTWYKRDWRGQPLEKRQTGPAGAILQEYRYDPLGRLTQGSEGPLATSHYKITRTYGNGVSGPAFVDEPISEVQVVNNVSKTVSYTYNTADETASLTYPQGCNESLVYARDAFGQVTAIDRNAARMANYVHAGRYPTFRQVRTKQASPEAWVELTCERPDQLRRPQKHKNAIRAGSSGGQGGTVTQSFCFENVFDPADNLDTQTVSNRPSENGLHDFTYDRLHRLTRLDYPNATSEIFGLDDLSNRESYTPRSGPVVTYQDNVLNQYTSVTQGTSTPAHDAKGNLVRDEQKIGYTYDFENRLIRVFTDVNQNGVFDGGDAEHVGYKYDALNRCVEIRQILVTSAESFQPLAPAAFIYRYFDGIVPVAQFSSSNVNSPTQVYFNGPTAVDEKLILRNGTAEYYYLHKDLMTVAGMIKPDGSLHEWYSYGAWGLPTTFQVQTPNSGNPFFFTGQRLNTYGQRVYDYKARTYDPRHGRFFQRDPGEFADSYNLYEYAASRVMVLTDPTGEFSLPEISLSSLVSRGLQAFNAASTARDVLLKARALAAGASFQSVLLAFVVEQALDRVGGDAFERALKLVQSAGQATRRAAFSTTAGKLAETAAGIKGPKISIEGIGRIPDEFNEAAKLIREIKFREGRQLQITDQLCDLAEWASSKGFRFELEVPVGTSFGKALQELIDQGKIVVKETLP